MKGPYQQESIVTGIFVLLLLLLWNPFGFFMPDALLHIMLGGIVVLFALYVTFIVKEKPADEREQLHRYVANRKGYLYGSAVLVIGVIYQGFFAYEIDPWLLITLGVMAIAKVTSLIHSEKNN